MHTRRSCCWPGQWSRRPSHNCSWTQAHGHHGAFWVRTRLPMGGNGNDSLLSTFIAWSMLTLNLEDMGGWSHAPRMTSASLHSHPLQPSSETPRVWALMGWWAWMQVFETTFQGECIQVHFEWIQASKLSHTLRDILCPTERWWPQKVGLLTLTPVA